MMVRAGLVSCLLLAATAAQSVRYRDQVFQSVDVVREVAYGSAVNRFSNVRQTLFLDRYTPRGDPAALRPAVVFVHGGGFRAGDKRDRHNVGLCNALARAGFVVASINYRLRPSGRWVYQDIIDASHDCKAAVRFVRKQAVAWRVDPARIGAMGGSAGAMTSLEAAYVAGDGQSGNPGYSSRLGAVVDLWGYLHDEQELDAGEAPFLIIHGTADQTVPFARAQALKARASRVGVECELIALQGVGHSPYGTVERVYMPRVQAFLWRHLRLAQLAGLAPRPGASTPTRLVFDHFGRASATVVPLLAATRRDQPFGSLGILCLPFGAAIALPAQTLPTAPQVATTSLQLPVPAGVRGDVYFQAIHVERGSLSLLTNCVRARF